jgi:hypothetical protein
MSLPQFPNVFYGAVWYQGKPAANGMIVTAVVEDSDTGERHFTIGVGPKGKFGAPNGIKLKVGGRGVPIADGARISFYCSEGPLVVSVTNGATVTAFEAGHSHFHADNEPHITRLVLCQD